MKNRIRAFVFVASLALALAPLACGPKAGARRADTAEKTTATERAATAEPKPPDFEEPPAPPATGRPRPGPR